MGTINLQMEDPGAQPPRFFAILASLFLWFPFRNADFQAKSVNKELTESKIFASGGEVRELSEQNLCSENHAVRELSECVT